QFAMAFPKFAQGRLAAPFVAGAMHDAQKVPFALGRKVGLVDLATDRPVGPTSGFLHRLAYPHSNPGPQISRPDRHARITSASNPFCGDLASPELLVPSRWVDDESLQPEGATTGVNITGAKFPQQGFLQ